MTKICIKCQKQKEIDLFTTDSRLASGKKNVCKECDNARAKTYQKTNLKKVLIKNALWREKNSSHYKKWQSSYRPIRNKKRKERYASNEQFKQKIIKQVKNYRDNPKNRLVINNTKRKLRKKYAQNPTWRLVINLRRRLLFALNGQRKADTTMKLVGCSPEQLRNYIESKFTFGMTWGNYGKWHIDHIRPCSSFDLSDPYQQRECFHYSNLQPLWAKDNLVKGDSLPQDDNI